VPAAAPRDFVSRVQKKSLVRARKAHDSILRLGDVYGNGSLSSEALTAMTDNTPATIAVHVAVS